MDEEAVVCDKCGEEIELEQDCWISVDAPSVDGIDGKYWTLCEECCVAVNEYIGKFFE